MRENKSKFLLIGSIAILVLAVLVLSIAVKQHTSCQQQLLSIQAVDQATSMSAAQSALEALQRGDMEVARMTLEEQIREGLVIIRTTRPELISGKTISDQNLKTIDDATKSAEKYAQEHKLDVSPP